MGRDMTYIIHINYRALLQDFHQSASTLLIQAIRCLDFDISGRSLAAACPFATSYSSAWQTSRHDWNLRIVFDNNMFQKKTVQPVFWMYHCWTNQIHIRKKGWFDQQFAWLNMPLFNATSPYFGRICSLGIHLRTCHHRPAIGIQQSRENPQRSLGKSTICKSIHCRATFWWSEGEHLLGDETWTKHNQRVILLTITSWWFEALWKIWKSVEILMEYTGWWCNNHLKKDGVKVNGVGMTSHIWNGK